MCKKCTVLYGGDVPGFDWYHTWNCGVRAYMLVRHFFVKGSTSAQQTLYKRLTNAQQTTLSIYARTPQFQVWYQSNPGTSPPYETVHFLHSFHIRTHHKHLYTEFGPISRPPSQKSAGPAYMHAPHNSKCGTSRTQAHPHNTNQCIFALISHSHSP